MEQRGFRRLKACVSEPAAVFEADLSRGFSPASCDVCIAASLDADKHCLKSAAMCVIKSSEK